MELIQVEVSREISFKSCEMCSSKIPHIHFYIKAKDKKYKTFDDCLAHTRDYMMSWANSTCDGFPQEFYSFNGGKTLEEFLHQDNIERAAHEAWKNDNCALSAEKLGCRHLMEKHIDEIIDDDKFRGFIKT